MHPDARLGWVHVSVADLDRSVAFYEGVLGLRVLRTAPGFAALGVRASDGAPVPLLFLSHHPHARPKPPHCRGLYHLALRLPTRRALAQAVLRLARHRWAIDGAADHWVSEAVYLSDRVLVLSKRPARILEEIRIDLPRPRSQVESRGARFAEYRARVYRTLRTQWSELL